MPRDVPSRRLSIIALGTVQTWIVNPVPMGTGAVGLLNRRGRFSEGGCAKTALAGVSGRHVLLQATKQMHIVWFPCARILFACFFFLVEVTTAQPLCWAFLLSRLVLLNFTFASWLLHPCFHMSTASCEHCCCLFPRFWIKSKGYLSNEGNEHIWSERL